MCQPRRVSRNLRIPDVGASVPQSSQLLRFTFSVASSLASGLTTNLNGSIAPTEHAERAHRPDGDTIKTADVEGSVNRVIIERCRRRQRPLTGATSACEAVYDSDGARAVTYGAWLHHLKRHRPRTGIGGLSHQIVLTSSRGTAR